MYVWYIFSRIIMDCMLIMFQTIQESVFLIHAIKFTSVFFIILLLTIHTHVYFQNWNIHVQCSGVLICLSDTMCVVCVCVFLVGLPVHGTMCQ